MMKNISLSFLDNLNSIISIDSFNISIHKKYTKQMFAIFKKNKVIYKYKKNYHTFYTLNNYELSTQRTSNSIIITFKGIISYRPIERKYIFNLIKELSFIEYTHIQRLDICIDFFYNNSYKKNLTKKDLHFHYNDKQSFGIRKYKLMKTAPSDEVEALLFYLNDITPYNNNESNTTYLHHKRLRKGSKYKAIRGLGNKYFYSYYYDNDLSTPFHTTSLLF